jgi:hypothetical protein
MELAGQKPPSFTLAVEIGKEYEETVRIFVTETKKAIAHTTSESLKEFLNSKKTLREQLEYAKERLQENSKEIEITTAEKTRLIGVVTALTDITEADRRLLSYYTDKVLCEAQNTAKETYLLMRKEFIEGCRHTFAASALREKISFDAFSASFQRTIGSSMTAEEKESSLDFVSHSLLEASTPFLLSSLILNAKSTTPETIQKEFREKLNKEKDKLTQAIEQRLSKQEPSYKKILLTRKDSIERMLQLLQEKESEKIIQLTLLSQDIPSQTTFDLSDDLLRSTTELEIEDLKKATLGSLETEIHDIEEQEKKLSVFTSFPKEQKSVAELLLTTKNKLLSEQTRIQSVIQSRKAEIQPKGFFGRIGRFFQNFWYRIRYQATQSLAFSQKYVLKNRF